jgi:hypothetical protein
MANFKFSKSTFSSTGSEEWGFESVGIFGEIPAMKGKRVTFTKKNLKGDKKVTLQIFPKKYKTLADAIKDDAVEKLSCTAPLSKVVRTGLAKGVKQSKMLTYLIGLEIQQSIEEPELYFLFSEKGDGESLPNFLIDDLAEERENEPVSLEDIAF